MVIQLIGAFIAVVAVAILIETPKRYLWCAGVVATAGWLVCLVCQKLGANDILATFLSAMMITIVAHVFARFFKAPVTVFLIPGIFPTVPGAGMYRIAYHLIEGENKLVAYYLTTTLELAGVIALGIFVVDAFFRMFQREWRQNSLRYHKNKEKEVAKQDEIV